MLKLTYSALLLVRAILYITFIRLSNSQENILNIRSFTIRETMGEPRELEVQNWANLIRGSDACLMQWAIYNEGEDQPDPVLVELNTGLVEHDKYESSFAMRPYEGIGQQAFYWKPNRFSRVSFSNLLDVQDPLNPFVGTFTLPGLEAHPLLVVGLYFILLNPGALKRYSDMANILIDKYSESPMAFLGWIKPQVFNDHIFRNILERAQATTFQSTTTNRYSSFYILINEMKYADVDRPLPNRPFNYYHRARSMFLNLNIDMLKQQLMGRQQTPAKTAAKIGPPVTARPSYAPDPSANSETNLVLEPFHSFDASVIPDRMYNHPSAETTTKIGPPVTVRPSYVHDPSANSETPLVFEPFHSVGASVIPDRMYDHPPAETTTKIDPPVTVGPSYLPDPSANNDIFSGSIRQTLLVDEPYHKVGTSVIRDQMYDHPPAKDVTRITPTIAVPSHSNDPSTNNDILPDSIRQTPLVYEPYHSVDASVIPDRMYDHPSAEDAARRDPPVIIEPYHVADPQESNERSHTHSFTEDLHSIPGHSLYSDLSPSRMKAPTYLGQGESQLLSPHRQTSTVYGMDQDWFNPPSISPEIRHHELDQPSVWESGRYSPPSADTDYINITQQAPQPRPSVLRSPRRHTTTSQNLPPFTTIPHIRQHQDTAQMYTLPEGGIPTGNYEPQGSPLGDVLARAINRFNVRVPEQQEGSMAPIDPAQQAQLHRVTAQVLRRQRQQRQQLHRLQRGRGYNPRQGRH